MRDNLWLRRLFLRHPIGAMGAALIGTLVAVALLAPLLAPYRPAAQIAQRLQPPSPAHLLGTDEFGRDMLSRIIYGSRISIFVGLVAVGIALTAGVAIGLLSGYFGGRMDHLAMRVMDIIFSFPALILAIAITGILGPSLTNATIAIGIVYTPTFARLARGTVLSVLQHEYVTAARALGASDARIMRVHVLPNIAAPITVQTTLNLSTAILAEAALSFLGLGTQPPDPSWGTMLGTGRRYMESAPWVAVFPGLAIMMAVLGFNLLGDGLRDILDPRLRAT
ncbi:MAG: ABC transporter permease [Armatimonadetes bacterium]|nr:ABC transporter permease [Armatimonadota bacterium]